MDISNATHGGKMTIQIEFYSFHFIENADIRSGIVLLISNNTPTQQRGAIVKSLYTFPGARTV